MRKTLFTIILMLSVCMFSGCDESFYTITYPEPVIVHPDNETAHTINGYRERFPTTSGSSSDITSSEENSSMKEEYIIYHANTSTKKFHLQSCRYAKKMDKEKLLVFDDYDEAINMGYSPCKICQKED